MASRLDFQRFLETLLESRNVYCQPPANISMKYPAIKYSRNGIDNGFADNSVYTQNVSYELTVIDEDPDSTIVQKVSKLPTCRFNREYRSDNLNHTVFTIKY